MKDDLAFLIERGDSTADNLENLIRATRDTGPGDSGIWPEPVAPAVSKGKPGPLTATLDEAGFGDDGEIKSEAERELLKAIRSAG